jgi:multisubunit Na+/H+ antiporter MnhB subunit
MKGGAILGLTIFVSFMFLYEWPKMNHKQEKEKAAFIVLVVMGLLLGVLLVFFPDLPGPTQLFETILKPFSKMLGK